MPDFNPKPNEEIVIAGETYTVSPHPAVPSFAFGQEGRKAYVFQLQAESNGQMYAIKKFKPAYRVEELIEVNDALEQFAGWRGLEVCARYCLTGKRYADILDQYPDLEYAVLMPWIGGSTWYDLVIGMTPLSRLEALTFAKGMTEVLAALEEGGLAHCDIAAPNVIINPTTGRAHLIDVEDMYAPGFSPPAALPAGTDGYAHKKASGGLWHPYADRFAGAVIIAEMLAWHDPRIRKEADEEHYFSPSEMQEPCPRLDLMLEVLGGLNPQLADLFEQAWFAEDLEDCPRFADWQIVIEELHHRERVSEMVPEWRSIMPGSAPPPEQEAEPTPPPAQPTPPPQPQPTSPEEREEVVEPEEEEPVEPEEEPHPMPMQQQPPASQPQPSQPAQASSPAVQTPMPPPAAPAPVVTQSGDGGPVVEWRSLFGSPQQPTQTPPPAQPTGGTQPSPASTQQAGNTSPVTGFDPIVPDPVDTGFGPLVEEDDLPEEAPEPMQEEPEIMEQEAADYGAPAEEHEPPEMVEEVIDEEPFVEPDELPGEDDFYAEEVHPDDDLYEEEAYPDETVYADEEPFIEPEVVDEEDYAQPLATPILDYTHTDALSRPHLVWSESMGADFYLLQESKDPHFDSPREFEIGADEDTRWNPTMPRNGRLFYRIKAVGEEAESGWSEIVGVRVGQK